MSRLLAGIIIILLIGGIGYFAYSGGFVTTQQVSSIAENVIDYKQPTGDVISIITLPPPEQPARQSQEQIMNEQRQISGINASSVQNSTVSGSAGQTYGFTDQYEIPYGANYFKIGTPVIVSAKLVKVIPNSCEQDRNGNLSNCDYVDPPKFKYNFYVTCEFRDFCSLKDISRWETTDNAGFLMQRIDTNPSSFTKGLYKATITANSEVKDASGRPYEIKADYYFTMVN